MACSGACESDHLVGEDVVVLRGPGGDSEPDFPPPAEHEATLQPPFLGVHQDPLSLPGPALSKHLPPFPAVGFLSTVTS